MKAVSEATCVERLADEQFGLGVSPLDPAHVEAALLRCEDIRHEEQFSGVRPFGAWGRSGCG